MSNENFIILSKNVWGDRFDYSECEYLGTSTKVRLYDKHRNKWIEQVPKSHLKGYEVVKLTKEEFFEKCNIIHDYKYEYDFNQYTSGLLSKISVLCREHGHFNIKAASHIYGVCCKKCDEYLFTKNIKIFLNENNISYYQQYSFDYGLPFDFYLPKYRMVIEFDGKQHFEPVKYFGGIEAFERLKKNNRIKNEYCEENCIDLLRIRYDQINNIIEILSKIFSTSK